MRSFKMAALVAVLAPALGTGAFAQSVKDTARRGADNVGAAAQQGAEATGDAAKLAGSAIGDTAKEGAGTVKDTAVEGAEAASDTAKQGAGAAKGKAKEGAAAIKGEAAKAEAVAAEASIVDINTAPEAELEALPGVGEVRAKKIVENRPYAKKDQLVSKGIVPKSVYKKIKDRIVAAQQ